MIVNVMNAFGERQHVEKFLPKVIKMVLNDETVKIHSYPGGKEAGTRFYIHGRNIAAAVVFLMQKGKTGEKYNISGEREVSNLEIAQLIAANVPGKELKFEMVDFHSSRPGHDLRYGLDGSRLFEMGFEFPLKFEESMAKFVSWTLRSENRRWLEEDYTEGVANHEIKNYESSKSPNTSKA